MIQVKRNRSNKLDLFLRSMLSYLLDHYSQSMIQFLVCHKNSLEMDEYLELALDCLLKHNISLLEYTN